MVCFWHGHCCLCFIVPPRKQIRFGSSFLRQFKDVATIEAKALLCQLSECRDEDEEALEEIRQLEESVHSARRRIDDAQAALQERSSSKPSMTPSTLETKPKQRSVLSLPEPA